jgi:hypothetical protein
MLIKESQLRAIIREELLREEKKRLNESVKETFEDFMQDTKNMGLKNAFKLTLKALVMGSALGGGAAHAGDLHTAANQGNVERIEKIESGRKQLIKAFRLVSETESANQQEKDLKEFTRLTQKLMDIGLKKEKLMLLAKDKNASDEKINDLANEVIINSQQIEEVINLCKKEGGGIKAAIKLAKKHLASYN